MSLLYYGSLSSQNGDTWKAELRNDSGVITTGTELILTNDGIVFKYDGDGDEFYTNPIRESSVSVFFNVDNTTDETFFEELSLQNEGDYAIVIYKNNNLYWIGRILPDIHQFNREPLINTTFEVVATDTLSFLDQYNISQNWFTNNKITGINLITEILKVSGLDAFWTQIGASNYIADALFTYNQTSGSAYHLANYEFNYLSFYENLSSLTNQVYPDFQVDINCKQALINILTVFNARMFLTDGMYHIVQPQSYSAGSSIVYDIYNTSGTLTSSNSSFPHAVQIATTNDRPQWNDFPIITAQPAIRELQAKLNNPLAFKYSFRDYQVNKSTAQMSVDEFEFNVGGGDIRVLANFEIDARNLSQNLTNPNYSEIKIKYRVFAWNGTSALFWDWEANKFSDPNPPNNGWRYKSVAAPVQKNYNRLQYSAEFDQTYTSAVGVSGSLSGYTIYAEFEIYYHAKIWNNAYLALDFGGYVRIIQEKLFPIEVKTTNTSLSPLASKKEEITIPYWDTAFAESVYRINVNNGTSFVEPGNWVSFNGKIGTLAEVFSNNLMSIYNKAVPVIQGNWIDNGSFDIKKSIVFDNKTWLFNGGTYLTYYDIYEGEWLCIDDDATGITIGGEDDIQDGNEQDKLQLQVGKQVWNDTGESFTDYSGNLAYDVMDKSDDAPSTAPSQITEFGVKISYNPTDDVLNWNVQELGKAVTVSSDETVTDTSIQIFEVDTALGSINLTLPTPSDVKGREYLVKKTHPLNTITVTGTIDGGGSYLLDYENESVVLVSNGLEYVVKSEYGKDDLNDVTTRGNTTENTVGVGALQLDLTPAATPTQGMIYWDVDEETAAVQVNGLNYEIGQGLYWVAKNQTGSTITKGTAVYASGTLGASGRILISPMIANGTIEAKYFLGITVEDITNGDDGKVITQGKIRQIDTSSYIAGDVLWVSSSTAGALTSTQPTGSNLALAVAFVVESASNGVLAVRVSVLDENAIGTIPTLDEVTTAGNTTTNDIEVGGLNVDSGTLYVDSTNNRVGIGTTSPARSLHVKKAGDNEVARFESDQTTSYIELEDANTTGQILIGTEGDNFKVHTSGSERLKINSSALTLSTTATNQSIVYWGTNTAYEIRGGGNYGYMGYNTGGHHRFMYAGTELMRITSGGNVLIGTTTDSGEKLQVSGNIIVGDSHFIGNQETYDNLLLLSSTGENIVLGSNTNIFFNTGATASDSVGTNRMYVDGTSGNVGIGTSNPSDILSINSSSSDTIIHLTNTSTGTTTADGLRLGMVGTAAYFLLRENAPMLFNTNNTERMRITNGGNVLIGTTTDSGDKLNVAGNISIGTSYKIYTGSASNSAGLDFGGSYFKASGYNGIIFYSSTAGVGSQTERMRITNGGNVGIGTDTPTVGLQLGNSTLGQTQLAIFNSEGGGEVGLTVQSRTNRAKLRVADNDSNAYVVAEAGKAFFGTSSNGDATNITVLTSGAVGIGTTSPGKKLDVAGVIKGFGSIRVNDSSTGSPYFGLYQNDIERAYIQYNDSGDNLVLQSDGKTTFKTGGESDRVTILSNGNVGIGTTDFGLSSFSNWNNLRLGKTANLFFHTSTNTFGFNIGRNFYFASDASYKYLTSDEAETIIFSGGNIDFNNATSGTEDASLTWNTRMRITNGGNVLIGTTTDAGYKFDVNGKMQIQGDSSVDGTMRIKSTKGTNQSHIHYGTEGDWYIRSATSSGKVVIQDSGGYVGIGTTSPAQELDVSGNINASGDYYANGTQGYTGTFTIQQPAPLPPINVDVNGGIITNVY